MTCRFVIYAIPYCDTLLGYKFWKVNSKSYWILLFISMGSMSQYGSAPYPLICIHNLCLIVASLISLCHYYFWYFFYLQISSSFQIFIFNMLVFSVKTKKMNFHMTWYVPLYKNFVRRHCKKTTFFNRNFYFNTYLVINN